MAKRTMDGDVKAGSVDAVPKKYSSKLMQMKFMQRGAKAAKAAVREDVIAAPAEGKAEQPKPREEDNFQWVVSGREDGQAGCRVILEGDPRPEALTGHMSFQEFNPAAEALQAERQQEADEAKNPGGKFISDAEMAKRLKPDPSPEPPHKSRGGGGRYYAA